MKRLALGVVLFALLPLASQPSSAQVNPADQAGAPIVAQGAVAPINSGERGSFPGCPQCGVWSWVDLPADQVTVAASDFTIHGWGFECISGQSIDRVDVTVQDYDGHWDFLLQRRSALVYGEYARPDVVQFGVIIGCPNVASHTGFTMRITGAPLGLRRFQFNVWRGPYFERHLRTYLVRP